MTYINSITICPESVTITKGRWYYGTCAQVCPTNATCPCVTWHSSNSNVASVNEQGYICRVSEGVAVIYATAQDGSGAVGFCNVTVVSPVKVSSVTVTPPTKTVNVGDSFGLSATVYPANAEDKRIRWTSCDCNIADVDYLTGCVTAKSVGTTCICANAVDGSETYGVCEVTVLPARVTGISLSRSTYTFENIGDVAYLVANVLPSNATNKAVIWWSNDDSVVSVNQSGRITAVSTNGKSVASAVITATTNDGGYEASCIVTVDTREKVIVSKDGNSNKITFANGKIWRCINCDMINNDTNAQNTTLQNRLYKNTYSNIVTDNYGNTGYYAPISYTANEMRLIYLIDPYGFANYVQL